MDKHLNKYGRWAAVAALMLLTQGIANTRADAIEGIAGPSFTLTAKADHISLPDGGSVPSWGYSAGQGRMQYPGPTLIVNQGDRVAVTLTSELPVPVSIVFPGQEDVVATGGSLGLLTRESTAPNDPVTYEFTALHPGTYLYHSGTHLDLQVEMGLVGALIVRPAGFDPATNKTAYGTADSAYDHEVLMLLTEMDPRIHALAAQGRLAEIDTTDYRPVYWFINGRASPDTMGVDFSPLLPTQPYGAMAMAYVGERVLMRLIGAGRDLHPFHHHGANSLLVGRDGAPLESAAGAVDLSVSEFTVQVVPGATYDAIFSWTGENLGWDIYGHGPDDPSELDEYMPDHGKPFPVVLPGLQDMTFGGFYSGSPFLGASAALPPGEGGLNPDNGFFFMWHSHNEKEMVNFDVFPGGMMTMFVVLPSNVRIH